MIKIIIEMKSIVSLRWIFNLIFLVCSFLESKNIYFSGGIMKYILLLIITFTFNITKQDVVFDGESTILMETDSKRILYGKNIDDVHLTASIAKIMTAIVAIENKDLNMYCRVDKQTTLQEGSSIYLVEGDKIKLLDLLYGLMLRSGNDAAYLIAISVSGNIDDFVKLMNNTAKKVGMTSSLFNNPSGLDEETCNYSTARDMALLMCYAMENDTFREISGSKKHIVKTEKQSYEFINKHRLVANGEAIAGKTGYTLKAKRTLVSCFKKNNMELVTVTFNCGNDFNTHRNLKDYAFNNFKMVYIMKRGIIDVYGYKITPVIYEDVVYPLKDNERIKCKIMLLNNPKENAIGKVFLYLDNEVVREYNIYGYYR